MDPQILYIAIFMSALTILMFAFIFGIKVVIKPLSTTRFSMGEEFEVRIKLLRRKYPNQKSEFWSNIISSYKHSIINKKDPSIIMIVSDTSTK